jgi:hypothetical protein
MHWFLHKVAIRHQDVLVLSLKIDPHIILATPCSNLPERSREDPEPLESHQIRVSCDIGVCRVVGLPQS